ncbi:MAG: phosphate transporter permease subunit PstC [Deltaproteobacteria bacterium]|jgi:phosphate transport system permease protein|nr:phosphate transporter permease subunit PstC [Deltaproteobacteria bacterium]
MATRTGSNPKDLAFEKASAVFAFAVLALTVLLFAVLLRESMPALRKFGVRFLVSGTWDPVADQYGALPFIYGTLLSSFLAILIAVPLSVGAAIFINEFAPQWLKKPVSFLAELLAAIPSVIYGLWGIFVLVPILRDYLMKPVAKYLGWIPLFKGPVYGPSVLAAGWLLSIMIVPFILSVSREVMATVPQRQKEAVLSLGGTRWEMIRIVIGQHCIPGIFGATVLGLGRALGETMAVTMVIGNRPEVFLSLFQQGYSMAAVIANEFAEAGGLQLSSLILIGLLLFLVTLVVNLAAKWILTKMVARASRGI